LQSQFVVGTDERDGYKEVRAGEKPGDGINIREVHSFTDLSTARIWWMLTAASVPLSQHFR
jgi:hypothetical protein